MLYREAGQFKTSYAADQQIFPIRQDRIAVIAVLVFARHHTNIRRLIAGTEPRIGQKA